MDARCVAVVLLFGLLAGCLGEDTPAEPIGPPGRPASPVQDTATHPTDDETGKRNETDDGSGGDGLPPAGPRAPEVWEGTYRCAGDGGFHVCEHHVNPAGRPHSFTVDALYEAITVTMAMQGPALVCCNSMRVQLMSPNGTALREYFHYGAYAGGEQVAIRVDDTALLNQAGAWDISLSMMPVAATVVEYEARVSFDPPSQRGNTTDERAEDEKEADNPEEREGTASVLNITMTELAVVNLYVPMEAVEPLVVPGARACAAPCVPVFSEVREEPSDSLAVVQVWAIRYADASVDGVSAAEGVIGLVSLSVRPVDHEPPMDPGRRAWFHFQPLMVAAPDALAPVLASWGIPTPDTAVSFSLEKTTDAWLGQVEFAGARYEIDWAVGGLGRARATTEAQYVFWTGDADELAGFAVWTESEGHHGVYWPTAVAGRIGPLGQIETMGSGEIAFFGDGAPVAGAAQVFRFTAADAL